MLTTDHDLSYSNIENLLRHLGTCEGSFACIYRPTSEMPNDILFLEGNIDYAWSFTSLSLETTYLSVKHKKENVISQLVLLPFNTLKDKGYACIDDGEPIIVMQISKQAKYSLSQFIDGIDDLNVLPQNICQDIDDTEYSEIVRTIIKEEINTGEGSNFVFSCSTEGDIADFSLYQALVMFKKLLQSEGGSYWTWMAFTGERYFIGSTPEQHIQVKGHNVAMNPISGTLKYPNNKNVEDALYAFLQDEKECNELFMVVDEELKMMSNICQHDVKVSGPKLKVMSHIAHTEYFINGTSTLSLKNILMHSLFAPTVTGGPIENACKVIARREKRGRGYYSGVVAMTGINQGKRYLDSAIIIRTADITKQGHFRLTSGSTIVKDSVPQNEASETLVKLQGLIHSFFGIQNYTYNSRQYIFSPKVLIKADQLLTQRNSKVSEFWLGNIAPNKILALSNIKITLIDMDDKFTEMIAYQLRSIGYLVKILPWYNAKRLKLQREMGNNDILLVGPGPGDPTNLQIEKIKIARDLISSQLKERRPLIGICLGHQLICVELGIPIILLPVNRQGTQCLVSLQNKTHYVAFYNSFSAMYDKPYWYNTKYGKHIHLEQLLETNEIIALSSERVSSIQFHNESFLTQNALSIYRWLINYALHETDV